MKTLVLQQPGMFSWNHVDEPMVADGEVLVKVRRCGVCGTDIHALAGRQPFFSYPRRLGHELCVEVISSPAGSRLSPGDLCAVEPYYFCGNCPACRSNKTNCCNNLKVLGVHIDGGHAPFMAIPIEKLHRARGLNPDQIALVEPLVIGAHCVERAAIQKGEPTVIIGMGPIGLAAAIFAKAAGANIVCVDVQPDRLDFACNQMNLGKSMPSDSRLGDHLKNYFGQLPSVIIDATGNSMSMKNTFQLIENGGKIVFLGLFIGEMTFDDPNFHRREVTLLASRAGLTETFRKVIEMMETKLIDPMSLITHRFCFSEADKKLTALHNQPGMVKAMIHFDDI